MLMLFPRTSLHSMLKASSRHPSHSERQSSHLRAVIGHQWRQSGKKDQRLVKMKSCLKTDSTHIYKVQPPRGKQRRGVHDPSGEGPTGQSAFFTGPPREAWGAWPGPCPALGSPSPSPPLPLLGPGSALKSSLQNISFLTRNTPPIFFLTLALLTAKS